MFKPTVPAEYYNNMTDQSTPEKRRGRFSRFLDNRKEEKKGVPPPMNTNNSHTNTDSAYASSENDPTRKATPDFVQVQNHEIPGVDQDRHLWLDKNNGEIYDEDTGDVVTTVTTTTTTTTTTTSRGGRKQEVVDVKTTQTDPATQNPEHTLGTSAAGNTLGNNLSSTSGQGSTLGSNVGATSGPTMGHTSGNNLGNTSGHTTGHTIGSLPPKQREGLSEMPANSVPATVHTNTAVPTYEGSSSGSSFMPSTTSHDNPTRPTAHTAQASISTRTDSSPPIPNKHPGRVSGEYSRQDLSEYESAHPSAAGPVSPVTPTRHNFSYPSRATPAGGAPEETTSGVARSGSTFANLKAAAIAAHGIGETLRGTLNEAVDSRYPRKDAAKAGAANTKNQAAIDRGRQEMGDFGSFRHQKTDQQGLSHTHTGNMEPTSTSHIGSTTAEGRYHPPTGTAMGNYPSTGTGLGSNPSTGSALGSHPPTTTDSYGTDSRPTETKSSGLGKLFKRKPLASESQGQTQNQTQTAKYF